MHRTHRIGGSGMAAKLTICLAVCAALAGCGTPGAPMPPSLKLPDPVTDLAAVRTGNQVTLTWKMPKKNTDKLLLKGEIPIRICRKENAGTCVSVPARLQLPPDGQGAFTEDLPTPLAAGEPRTLAYFVELVNKNGRSAGLSNPATVLAGRAPAPVANLSAKVVKAGVVLRWTKDDENEAVRLHRKLLTAQPETKSNSEAGPFAAPPEPVERNLLVEPSQRSGNPSDQAPGRALGRALDKDIRFGQVYEYRAQHVARVTVDGKLLELAGSFSAPIRVELLDVFPPAIPTGLAAVATFGQAGVETAIDLSWQPVTDADLAGYAVYRLDPSAANEEWRRISSPQPQVPPSFHDTQVQPGHTYRYAVTAIDQGGHESGRSVETEETVPNP